MHVGVRAHGAQLLQDAVILQHRRPARDSRPGKGSAAGRGREGKDSARVRVLLGVRGHVLASSQRWGTCWLSFNGLEPRLILLLRLASEPRREVRRRRGEDAGSLERILKRPMAKVKKQDPRC